MKALLKIGVRVAYRLFGNLPPKVRQKIIHPFVLYSRKYGEYHLVSFPKCGRTWLRMMIGYCFVHHFDLPLQQYLEIDLLGFTGWEVPLIGISHDGLPQFKEPGELGRSKSEYQNQKVIFLVRDPRDVIVSNYFQQTKRRETFEGSLDEFVHRKQGGIETLLEFYDIWYEQREVPRDFLLVRYEDLHRDVRGELNGLLNYLELDNVSKRIRSEAVEEASFENMKTREQNYDDGNFRLQPGDPGDPESYKIRRGIVGGYKDYLDQEHTLFIEERMNEKLPSFYGYRPNRG